MESFFFFFRLLLRPSSIKSSSDSSRSEAVGLYALLSLEIRFRFEAGAFF